MSEFLINIIIATVSGFLGALILYIIQEIRDKKKKILISDYEDKKTIDRDVVEKISPGYSLEKAKNILGAPLIIKKIDETVFETGPDTNSYIYNFKNALLKITTKDNIKIDTTTILFKYKSKKKIDFIPSIFDPEIEPFGKCKLKKSFIELVRNHSSIRTIKENSCAVEILIPNPLYKYFTYFLEYSSHVENYYNSNNINDLLGAVIYGVCISDEEKLSFFIYDYELR